MSSRRAEGEWGTITCPSCGAESSVKFDAQQSMAFCQLCGEVIRESLMTTGSSNLQWDPKTGVCGVMLSQNQDGGEIARALVRAEKQGFGSSHRFFSSYAAKEKEVLAPDATTPHLQKVATLLGLSPSAIYETRCILSEIGELTKFYITKAVSDKALEMLVSACVYISCRKLKLPVSIHQVASASGCDCHILGGLISKVLSVFPVAMPPMALGPFVSRALSQLKMNLKDKAAVSHPKTFSLIGKQALSLVRFSESRSLSTGRKVTPLAGAILSMVLSIHGVDFSTEEVATTLECAEGTIVSRLEEIQQDFRELKQYIFKFGAVPGISMPLPDPIKQKGSIPDRYIMLWIEKLQQEMAQCSDHELQQHQQKRQQASTAIQFIPTGGLEVSEKEKRMILMSLLNANPPMMRKGLAAKHKATKLKKYCKILRRVHSRASLWKRCHSGLDDVFPITSDPKCEEVVYDWKLGGRGDLVREDIDLIGDLHACTSVATLYEPGSNTNTDNANTDDANIVHANADAGADAAGDDGAGAGLSAIVPVPAGKLADSEIFVDACMRTKAEQDLHATMQPEPPKQW